MIWTGATGGSLTTVPGGSVASCNVVDAVTGLDGPERLPMASAASTVYV
jgi:hypothetical protein